MFQMPEPQQLVQNQTELSSTKILGSLMFQIPKNFMLFTLPLATLNQKRGRVRETAPPRAPPPPLVSPATASTFPRAGCRSGLRGLLPRALLSLPSFPRRGHGLGTEIEELGGHRRRGGRLRGDLFDEVLL
jgi:hypothetical protein